MSRAMTINQSINQSINQPILIFYSSLSYCKDYR